MGSYPRSRLLSDGSNHRLINSMRTENVVSLNFLPSNAPILSTQYPSGYMKLHPGSLNLVNRDG